MSGFDSVFTTTLALEGGFVDDPRDSGGATRYGITERVARANGYAGPMRELPIAEARRIAKAQYWDTLRLDDVDRLSPAIAKELFDTGYNMGIVAAGRMLQRSLNVLNRQGADYGDLVADGVLGPMSIAALRAYLAKRGPAGAAVLLRALNALQGAAYIELAERRAKDEAFVYGWLKNRVEIEA